MLCVYLAFIAQYSNILLKIFSLVSLFDSHTEKKILTFVNTNGRPDMLSKKVLNERFI